MPLVSAAASRVRSRSLLAVCSLAALSVFALTGCTTEPTPGATAGSTSSATPTDVPSTEPSGEATPSATPGIPVTMSCAELLTADDVYNFNPNVGTDDAVKPADGSLAAAAVADNGIACGYLHQSSNETMIFALSQPSPEQLTLALNTAATASTAVPTYGAPPEVTGFFDSKKGEVQVFTPTYWLTATSTMFFEPGDADALVRAALSHLPQ